MKSKEVLVTPEVLVPEVEEVNLQAHDRETGVKAVVDKSTMETICVVPIDYQLIQHNHVIAEVNKLTDYLVKKTILSNSGRKIMIELVEREPKKVALLPDDFIEVGARVYNDYGKSRGMSVQAFATRLVCTNGMTSPEKMKPLEVLAYGTSEFHTELETKINASFKAWQDPILLEKFEKANEFKVSIKDIEPRLPHLPRKYMELVLDKLEEQDTIFNIFNAYTQVITHEIGPKVQTAGLISLQKKANKILELVKVVQ